MVSPVRRALYGFGCAVRPLELDPLDELPLEELPDEPLDELPDEPSPLERREELLLGDPPDPAEASRPRCVLALCTSAPCVYPRPITMRP